MERLKEKKVETSRNCVSVFTFQYGEIKSVYTQLLWAIDKLFTFQYGEIKRTLYFCSAIIGAGFTFQYGEIKSSFASATDAPGRKIYIPVWRD